MGKADTRRDVPIVHPIIKLSEDHFKENTAFADGTYRVLEEQRRAYEDAEEIQFDDVVGFVKFELHIHMTTCIIFQITILKVLVIKKT